MELTMAKSQGYLKNQLHQSGSSSGRKLLAVIGVYTGFGSRLKRNVFRSSWMPKGDALTKLEERGVVIRFVIGRSANRGDSLDRNIDEENHMTKDFLILDGHEEAQEEFPKKAKFFFSTAVQNWDAEFYVKVDDSIDLDLDGLIELLQSRRGQDSAYIGCMKSGVVIAEDFAATLCTSQPALVLPWKPVMLPQDFMEFMNDLTFQAKNKIIPMSRIDDAVKRILRVKFMMGLFEKPLADLSLVNQLGSQEHRELAREAVRKSLVLLKNGKTIANPLLPLPLFWLCSI